MGKSKINFKRFPGTIKELLKLLCGKDVIIILAAEDGPENIKIEAIIGDLLVAETNCNKFKFVDIDCICAVMIDREELLEGIFQCDDEEAENADCGKKDHAAANEYHENVAGLNSIHNAPCTKIARY